MNKVVVIKEGETESFRADCGFTVTVKDGVAIIEPDGSCFIHYKKEEETKDE